MHYVYSMSSFILCDSIPPTAETGAYDIIIENNKLDEAYGELKKFLIKVIPSTLVIES